MTGWSHNNVCFYRALRDSWHSGYGLKIHTVLGCASCCMMLLTTPLVTINVVMHSKLYYVQYMCSTASVSPPCVKLYVLNSIALVYYRRAVHLIPDIEYRVNSKDRPQHMKEEGSMREQYVLTLVLYTCYILYSGLHLWMQIFMNVQNCLQICGILIFVRWKLQRVHNCTCTAGDVHNYSLK